MKRIIAYVICIIVFATCIPKLVFAGSVTVSPGSLSMYVGESKTFSINAANAAGRVDISSNNGCISVSPASTWVENGSVAITVTGNSVCSTTVIVTLTDVAPYDSDEPLTGSRSVSVSVTNKPAPQPDPTPTPSTPSTPTTPSTPSTPQQPIYKETEKKIEEKKSNNTKLKELSVEGYKLETTDNVNYLLTVNNQVDKIKINASTEDSKSTVTGIGEHALVPGENVFKIAVTAEDGTKKEYNVVIYRKKDKYYLEDLKDALKDDAKTIEIILKDGDIISVNDFNLIKEKDKEIKFNKYDTNNKEEYSFTINSKDITEAKIFNTMIIKEMDSSKYKNKFNYGKGINIQFSQKEEFPNGTKVRIYVGDKYKNGEKLELYYYDDTYSSSIKIKDNIEVVNGYIVLDVKKGTDYFVKTKDKKATIATQIEGSTEKKIDPFLIISIIEAIIIVVGIIFFIRYKKKMETKIKSYSNNSNAVVNTAMPDNNNSEVKNDLPEQK